MYQDNINISKMIQKMKPFGLKLKLKLRLEFMIRNELKAYCT